MFRNYSFNEKDPSEKHSFEIHNVDISIINGIRRVLLTDIPIPGIVGEGETTIDILQNDGPLHNEIMMHRIGLLPICMTEDDIETYEDNSIELELKVSNTNIGMLNVHTGNIKGNKNGKELTEKELVSMFPKNIATDSHILITRLRPSESIHFKANVVKRTARINSAFCPVSLSNFFYMEDETVSKKAENVLDKERSYYMNKYGEATSIQFEIESINRQIGPKYLINKAFDIITKKIADIASKLAENSPDIVITQFEELANTYEFKILNEDDTVGNIIQSIIHNTYIRNKSVDMMNCSYIGYICPHPLKYELVIRITLENTTSPKDFSKFLQSNCITIVDHLMDIRNEWNQFIK